MIAKLIVHERDRKAAIERMKRALGLTVIEGVKTTVPLHQKILADQDFQEGRYNTRFLERFVAKGTAPVL
jgi:acetyl-CoA carboxylase biotin carboxylase subunit